jgi:hypothetical protein
MTAHKTTLTWESPRLLRLAGAEHAAKTFYVVEEGYNNGPAS